MSSKQLSNSPKPENILNALQQASTPLSINELASKTNVVARNLLNPIIKQMIQAGQISQTTDSPPKFKLSDNSGFALTSKSTAPKASAKATDNVVHISPKNSRQPKEESPAPAAAPKTAAANASQSSNVRDGIIQLLQEAPQQIALLEDTYPDFADLLANLHADGLIIQDKLIGSETIWLSPKGEDLYTKLLADGVLSPEAPAPSANASSEPATPPAAKPAAAKKTPGKKAAATKGAAEPEGKRPPGRPKGSTNKKSADEEVNATAKSAAPKSSTAAPAPKAAEKPAATVAPAPAAAASPAPVADSEALNGLGDQLMGLLQLAAKNAVQAQVQAQTLQDERNTKIAQDMSALSDLMIEMGNRLKSLSETMTAE
ncbi:hypothetical protein IFT69_16585 [Pseudomonas putida]|nr:hypothetical protein [Pseudomonas putida]